MMTYPWGLLSYIIRRPCALCKISDEWQQQFYELFRERKSAQHVRFVLANAGVHVPISTVYTHRDHLRQFVEHYTHVGELNSTLKLQLELQRTHRDKLKLARERDEMVQAIMDALSHLVNAEKLSRILNILNEEDT